MPELVSKFLREGRIARPFSELGDIIEVENYSHDCATNSTKNGTFLGVLDKSLSDTLLPPLLKRTGRSDEDPWSSSMLSASLTTNASSSSFDDLSLIHI